MQRRSIVSDICIAAQLSVTYAPTVILPADMSSLQGKPTVSRPFSLRRPIALARSNDVAACYPPAPPRPSSFHMRLWWSHIWRLRAYQRGTATERRMIEIRFSIARAVRQLRRRRGLTQRQVAHMIGANQATVSRMERASTRVSLELAFLAMIALGATDAEIGNAANANALPDVKRLRARMALKYAKRPAPGFVSAMRRSGARSEQ
jgi:transcriptional regulator with XRE-family HTH domain